MVSIKKILCPVDFSPISDNAASYAAGLALNYGARLKLLHIVSPNLPVAYEFVNTAELLAQAEERSKHLLGKLLGTVKASGAKATAEVRTGEILSGIQKTIESYKPDLVIMGTHGRTKVERWFMGSVTERLLRHSPVPLMTISSAKAVPRKERRFPRIVVTTDFSEGTADALKYAFSIAQENQARITLLHVITGAAVPQGGRVMKGLERQLNDLIPAEVQDWCKVETRLETGAPYQRILEFAKDEGIDLIVMNIHGKGMLARALVGSNAERVVRAATCPVMLIPPMQGIARKAVS